MIKSSEAACIDSPPAARFVLSLRTCTTHLSGGSEDTGGVFIPTAATSCKDTSRLHVSSALNCPGLSSSKAKRLAWMLDSFR